MTYDCLVNRGEYLSAHYLAEMLPKELRKKEGLTARWVEREKAWRRLPRAERDARPPTARAGLAAFRDALFEARPFFRAYGSRLAEGGAIDPDDAAEMTKRLNEFHGEVLKALGFAAARQTIEFERAGRAFSVQVACAEPTLVAVECGWATEVDAALDDDQAGRLLVPVELESRNTVATGKKLAEVLFAADHPPRYVLILAGTVVILADRTTWGEGRYLAVSLDVALGRRDPAEIDLIAALFGAESLLPPAEGGPEPLVAIVAGSRQHAAGVSAELREGLRISVEKIANEVLARIRDAGVEPEQIMEHGPLARELTREALRYLYRILFLLYAEARPELGILPVDHPEYAEGYGMARLGDLVVHGLTGETSRNGFHLYESLNLLFRMVNKGYPADSSADGWDGAGIRFEALRSALFEPEAIKLIGRDAIKHPAFDPADPDCPRIDTRLRNFRLHEVLRLLMLTRGKDRGSRRRRERGGFISYAQLGINQLGAVYEGLMSYTGSIAEEELYEVAKKGDATGASWTITATQADSGLYTDEQFVREVDEEGNRTEEWARYRKGSFVYRLAGRDRETSASYYTPESLTQTTVRLALQHRLEQEGEIEPRKLLEWRICEPALGSGAFLNEAINQVAVEYLKRAQERSGALGERYAEELQKVKAYIALHNCYGVDLNETATELAEVSLWLNVMHRGLQAPWFGLHLRRGNSLIGAGRRLYGEAALISGDWLAAVPEEVPLTQVEIPAGAVHHFLLPATGWGSAAGAKEARDLAGKGDDRADWQVQLRADIDRLAAWRKQIRKIPSAKRKRSQPSQMERLQAVSRRAEFLWKLVLRRLELSEEQIRRRIDVFGADWIDQPDVAVPKEKIYRDLHEEGKPFWRLKTVMDAWCALWFWPLDQAGLLDGSDPIYERHRSLAAVESAASSPGASPRAEPEDAIQELATEQGRGGVQESFGFPVRARQLYLPDLEPATPVQLTLDQAEPAPAPKKKAKVPPPPPRGIRDVIPLADLDDWLDFAEAVLGRADMRDDIIPLNFNSLDELGECEEELPKWMVTDSPLRLQVRFPWLRVITDGDEGIAIKQGFFHWELAFAHAFRAGGFDLQVGNPPWVRPRWEEGPVLAEREPWFELKDKPSTPEWRQRKARILADEQGRRFVLDELAAQSATSAFYSSVVNYDLLNSTQPDLYRAFMMRTWANAGSFGTVGLLHPDTHFVGDKEKRLRAAAYRRLRVHADFVNAGNRFFPPPVNRSSHFGLHVYGPDQEIGFDHVSWLYHTTTLIESLDLARTAGVGEAEDDDDVPGVRYGGDWDLRPHPSRVVHVDREVLAEWRRIRGDEDVAIEEARLLYPVTTRELPVIVTFGEIRDRLDALDPRISRGYDEKGAKDDGLIKWEVSEPGDWSEVILKGPQFGVATPFFKQPPDTGTGARPLDLTALSADAVPATNYRRATDRATYEQAQKDRWVDHWLLTELRDSPAVVEETRLELALGLGIALVEVTDAQIDEVLREKARRRYTQFYRLAWREMIPDDTERSLFGSLFPPGPAHVHGVRSMALATDRETVLAAGFWAALPVDYMLRVAGIQHLDVSETRRMPGPKADHPLAAALMLRTLRLNCLTDAYAPLWEELYDDSWRRETWALDWPGLPPVGEIGRLWKPETALRSEYARRAALVEIDAIAGAWLGLTAEQLGILFRARFPILFDYEAVTYFDANGRKIAGNWNTFGSGQSKEHWEQFSAFLDDERSDPPQGFVPIAERAEALSKGFYKADRACEMRQAHAMFAGRLAVQDADSGGVSA